MEAKSDKTFFMGYALNSKTYRVFNKTSLIVEESIHIIFHETNAASRKCVIVDDDVNIEDSRKEELKEKEQEYSNEDPPLEDLQRKEAQHENLLKAFKFVRDHHIDLPFFANLPRVDLLCYLLTFSLLVFLQLDLQYLHHH